MISAMILIKCLTEERDILRFDNVYWLVQDHPSMISISLDGSSQAHHLWLHTHIFRAFLWITLLQMYVYTSNKRQMRIKFWIFITFLGWAFTFKWKIPSKNLSFKFGTNYDESFDVSQLSKFIQKWRKCRPNSWKYAESIFPKMADGSHFGFQSQIKVKS